MVRTVVYREPRVRRDIDIVESEQSDSGKQQEKDQFSDKLVKYIPAEVIAFFLPAYALVEKLGQNGGSTDPAWLPEVLVVAGVIGVVGYLYLRAPKDNPPHFYFYILAVLAFLAWAAGTSDAGEDVFNLPEVTGKVLVAVAVFLVPLLDEVLTRLLPARS